MGVSGGSISNMVLTLYGKPIHARSAPRPASACRSPIAGTIGYVLAGLPHQALTPPFSLGFVSLIGFALMAPVSSFTALYGARLAHMRCRSGRLEIAFGFFLLRGLGAVSSSSLHSDDGSDCRAAPACRRAPPSSPAG